MNPSVNTNTTPVNTSANTTVICFKNKSSTAERIQVLDAESAEALKRILGRLENESWVIEGEEAESAPAQTAEVATEVVAPAVPATLVTTVPVEDEVEGVKEFRVILISGSSTFRCRSKDVSLEGMRVKSAIPASFLSKQCTAYVSGDERSRENLELTCEVITDSNGVTRIAFVSPKETDLEKLSGWLMPVAPSNAVDA